MVILNVSSPSVAVSCVVWTVKVASVEFVTIRHRRVVGGRGLPGSGRVVSVDQPSTTSELTAADSVVNVTADREGRLGRAVGGPDRHPGGLPISTPPCSRCPRFVSAWRPRCRAPAVSSFPVDQPSTTLELTAADSVALNVTAEPSVAEASATATVTPSSPVIVPIALAVAIVTPAGQGWSR